MSTTHIEMQQALLSGGMAGLSILLNGHGVNVAYASAAAATATAIQSAESGKTHEAVGFDISIYDADLAADGYVKVELKDDPAGGATTLWANYYKWDITADPQVITIQEQFPWPFKAGTEGNALGLKVTTGVAADAVAVNLYTVSV